MNKINSITNPKKILTYNEANMYTQKEYELLKQKANQEIKRIKKDYNLKENSKISQKFIEYIIKNTHYQDMSILKKEILLANSLLPNDIKIIDQLTKEGFTIEHIKTIIRFRDILKNSIIHKQILTPELKEHLEIYKSVTSKLINIFNDNFYVNNSTIILNKLCELLATKPQLFNEISKDNKKTLKK